MSCWKPPVCFGDLSPDALRRWTVVTTLGGGRKHWNKEGDGKSSLSSLQKDWCKDSTGSEEDISESKKCSVAGKLEEMIHDICIKILKPTSPESDLGVGKEAQEEASRGTWQKGGGQHDVATRRQSPPQRHTAGVYVDRAGRLLRHTLHPAAAVHLHLGHKAGGRRKEVLFWDFRWN